MSRGSSKYKRTIAPDPVFKSELLEKFINCVMDRGKKTVAQKIVYGALEKVGATRKVPSLQLFEETIERLRPQVEVRSRRVGGANYQIPLPVSAGRQNALAFRWLIVAAKARKGTSMTDRLSAELLDVLEGIGAAIKKKEDVHRMAEANKAFAHFARFGKKKK